MLRLTCTSAPKVTLPSFVYFQGYTAVMVAADQGDSEALKALLEAGANINCRVSRIRFSKLTTITNHTSVASWKPDLAVHSYVGLII